MKVTHVKSNQVLIELEFNELIGKYDKIINSIGEYIQTADVSITLKALSEYPVELLKKSNVILGEILDYIVENETSFSEILIFHTRKMMCNKFLLQMNKIYQEAYEQLNTIWGKLLCKNNSKESKEATNTSLDSSLFFYDFKKQIEIIHKRYFAESNKAKSLYDVEFMYPVNFWDSFEKDLRMYCAKYRRKETTALKSIAVSHKKNKENKLTPKEWGKVYEDEVRRLQELFDTDNEIIDIRIYQNEEKDIFFSDLNESCNGDDLFDRMHAIKTWGCQYLYEGNRTIIYSWILRYNIILCEMFPKLKPQFEAWLNGIYANSMFSEPENRGPLFTPEAMILWGKLKEAGYVDENFQPLVTKNKASIIAKKLGEKLGLSPLWKPFEKLWNKSELSKAWTTATSCKYNERHKYENKIVEIINK